MKLTNAYIIDGDVIKKRIAELEEFKKIMIDAVERKELDVLKKIMHHAKPALPIVEESAVEFAKWLKHNDNGDTHYNIATKETSPSIGFSPYDCFIDDIKTETELFSLFKQDFLTKDF